MVNDFDISPSKMADTAQRVVDRAVEEALRREHGVIGNEHIFLAFAQVEWDLFAHVMRDLKLNPHQILSSLEEHMRVLPSFAGRNDRNGIDGHRIDGHRTGGAG